MIKPLLLIQIFLSCNALSSIRFFECDKTKACFKTSKSCTEDTCEFAISWKTVYNDNVNFIEFEIVGNIYSNNGYLLVGFSEDKKMGNDGIIGCFVENNEVKAISGYYDENDNFIPLIMSADQDFLVRKDGDKLGGNFNELTKRIFCRFRRRVTPNHFSVQLKDLASGRKYYLITLRGSRTSENEFGKHLPGSLVFSSEPVDLSTSSSYPLRGSSDVDSALAKTHGILMIIAWVFCSSIGIIVARYYKDLGPLPKNVQESVSFKVHRSLQAICVIITSIAFILIFIHVKGYSQLDSLPYKAHPILGIIVFVLMFLNPLLALCRCKTSSKNRPWFNWIHFFIGTIAYCFSMPTIMIGMRLPAAGLALSKLDFPQWILIIFVVFQFIIELILEIHGCFYYSRYRAKTHTFEREIEEYQSALISNQEPTVKPSQPRQSGKRFRYFILGFHGIVALIVTILLLVIIVIY